MGNPPSKKTSGSSTSTSAQARSKGGPSKKSPNIENNPSAARKSQTVKKIGNQSGGGARSALTSRDRAHLENIDVADLMQKYAEMQEALEKEKASNAELREQLNEVEEGNVARDRERQMIPRPKGTAGTNFSIQEEMGLCGGEKKYDIYKALQRNIRDLALNARIPWELSWAQIPSKDKALLFDVAREQHPFLKRFVNDWATEELVKQYIKNKRKNHYKNGWLEVPTKYAHLKENSLKRDPSASRKKKALTNAMAAKKIAAKKQRLNNARNTVRAASSNEEDEDEDEDEGYDQSEGEQMYADEQE